ncbi:MAG: tetratricopeptide repeat protein [Kiritimatiellales bacterium]|nr:tetratricopeptide repeat protein [Kiritimatiellales bacterium]
MISSKTTMYMAGVFLMFAAFFGCGERAGEREYKKAIEAWHTGDLVQARTLLEKSNRKISGGERKAEAYNRLGLILWKLQDQEQSIKAFNDSCRISPNITGANVNLGAALFLDGQREPAEFELTKVLNDQPENSVANAFMGMINLQKKAWNAASANLKDALRRNPSDPAVYNALAITELHQNGNSDAAVAHLENLLSENPDYAPALFNLAVIYERWLNAPKEALAYYTAYSRKAATGAPYMNEAQNSILRLSKSKPSTQPTTAVATPDPSEAEGHLARGSSLYQQRKYKEAIQEFNLAIGNNPKLKTAHYNLGMAFYSLKDYTSARKAYLAALSLDSRYTSARYNMALSYYQEGKLSEAEQQIKLLLSQQPDHGKARELLKFIQAKKR